MPTANYGAVAIASTCFVVAAIMLAAAPALADPQFIDDQAPAAVAIPGRLQVLRLTVSTQFLKA